MRTRNLAWFTAVLLAPVAAYAESPKPRQENAERAAAIAAAARKAWAITDLVLQQDIDPPARQQMLLHGLKAMLSQRKGKPPANFAERVSTVTTPEQFAALLAEVWSSEEDRRDAGPTEEILHTLFSGLLGWRTDNARPDIYLSPLDLKRHEMIAGNRYVGTGIQIRVNDKEKLTQIMVPFPGGPARKAGARPGDLIVEVDGKSMKGLTISKVVECLQGEEGTKVSMTVRQPGESKTRLLPMVRSLIPFSSVHGHRRTGEESWSYSVDSRSPIGYLAIDSISISTSSELRKIEPSIRAEGFRAVVWDLRFSRGDDLRYAALVADAFIDGGALCRLRDMPMVVLVGEHTGSMAAIVAAALQDRGRAVIVGEMPKTELTTTSLVHLPEERGAVLLRTGRVERIESAALKKQQRLAAAAHRLLPDYQVEPSRKEMAAVMEWRQQQESPEPKADAKPPSDPQLDKALAVLREALGKRDKKDKK